jgi:hypothetical protein
MQDAHLQTAGVTTALTRLALLLGTIQCELANKVHSPDRLAAVSQLPAGQ